MNIALCAAVLTRYLFGQTKAGRKKPSQNNWDSNQVSVYSRITLSRVGGCAWLIRRVLDWMIGFIDTLFTQLETTRNYSDVADLHSFEFTVTHALGFSVFTSRILATDWSQSHSNFKSHMKFPLHSLRHFFPFLLNHRLLPSLELDPILDN
jgi:hypothetical protein